MNYNFIDDIIEDKLLELNTAYIAKVLKVNDDNTANIQPLSMIKQYGKEAITPAVLQNVPIIQSARYKLNVPKADTTLDTVRIQVLKESDIVFCVCSDRDISTTKKGIMATPQIGHHSKSDSIIIGIL